MDKSIQITAASYIFLVEKAIFFHLNLASSVKRHVVLYEILAKKNKLHHKSALTTIKEQTIASIHGHTKTKSSP